MTISPLNILNPFHIVRLVYYAVYNTVQSLIIALWKPPLPKKPDLRKPFGRVAVIGGGLSGVSSAAHCMAHNFEVVIFEQNGSIGGIWSHVNYTSGLQLNSMLYRFHPGVRWSKGFPLRDEIVNEIRRIWKEYGLEKHTRFNTPVTKITRHSDFSEDPEKGGHACWVINDGEDGIFDAVIATIGTCGEPNMIKLENQNAYKAGKIVHSSQLDDLSDEDLVGKSVLVVGSGASGVESVELAVARKAGDVKILARDDKWIIPRNIVFDTLLSMQPFGREMYLSFIPEWLLKSFHYRDLKCLAPTKGFYEGTPIVNDDFLQHVREGKASYIRGDTIACTNSGLRVNVRGSVEHGKKSDTDAGRQTHSGDKGVEQEFKADIMVLATGFHPPSVRFLPKDLFPERYQRPNLYLQNFSTEDWSVLLTNSAYKNGIGSVGHFHIGIYTRILLAFLLDPSIRPLPEDLKLWVDGIRWIKRDAPGGALSFFTYMELTIWVVSFLFLRWGRLKWAAFILFGWGVY